LNWQFLFFYRKHGQTYQQSLKEHEKRVRVMYIRVLEKANIFLWTDALSVADTVQVNIYTGRYLGGTLCTVANILEMFAQITDAED
jgi:hypothetical protein